MTLPEFAAAVGASRSYVYELARDGRLPVPLLRIGNKLLVSRAAVARLLAEAPPAQGVGDDGGADA